MSEQQPNSHRDFEGSILDLELRSLSYPKKKREVLRETLVKYMSTNTAVICGPMGSGKTSLQYCLASVIPNVESFRTTNFDGRLVYQEGNQPYVITKKNYRWFLDKISILFQYPDNNFIADKVIDEFNLLKKIIYDPLSSENNHLISQLNIRDLALASITSLSEGQKQMVALACMFLRNPAIVFLDEPLTMLDTENRRLFLDWLGGFKRNYNYKGLVITTHRACEFEFLEPTHFIFHEDKHRFVETDTLTLITALPKSTNEYNIWKASPYYHFSKASVGRKLITVDRTSIYYQKNVPIRGLANLNFSIDEDQHILLTGANGAGKSTIAKTLCGVHKKFDGEIRIFGENIKDVDPIKAGFVKMVVQIPSQQIIFETVHEELRYSIRNLNESFIDGRLSEIKPYLASFGISFDEDPHTLSFGQQKVICLLAHLDFPRVLFIDEPSISLDQSQQKTIFDIIQFYQSHGVTTVVITQEPGMFRKLCKMEFTLEK